MPARIDLHTHSTASDGTDTPAQLVAAAAAAGLDVVALTDHDTTRGWAEAAAALPAGLSLVRGAEFSCVLGGIPIHLLGYLFDPAHPAIVAEQARLRAARHDRLLAMTGKIADAGYPVDVDAVLALLPDGASAGRPHLARALVGAGVVGSVDEAFARLLYTGSPFYVEKVDTPAVTAVEMVRAAGGVAVFAHPLARRRGRVVDERAVAELAAAGLAGLEVDHPDHTPDDRGLLRRLAAELDLLVTGSSDYHGTNKTTAIGAETTAPEQFDALVARAGGLVEVLAA
jgi:predicted metal-dependent phosphoesterase TrpH